MKNKIPTLKSKNLAKQQRNNTTYLNFNFKRVLNLPEILFISSYPPRECGIATYSEDLLVALNNKFKKSFDIKIAALQLAEDNYEYPAVVKYILETDNSHSYEDLARTINKSKIELVVIQHEFGLFKSNEADFLHFLKTVNKPIVVGFHTVLPNPDQADRKSVV